MRPSPPFARRHARHAAAAAAIVALPVPSTAATTMTVTLSVSSTVAAPPGTCLFAPDTAPAAGDPAALGFALACSGSGPYFVTIDGAADALNGTTPASDSVRRDYGTGYRQTFTLPAVCPGVAGGPPRRCPVAETAPAAIDPAGVPAPTPRAVTATVRY